MPSGGYSLLIHRYPILRCGVHVPVVTIYVVVKAACFNRCLKFIHNKSFYATAISFKDSFPSVSEPNTSIDQVLGVQVSHCLVYASSERLLWDDRPC